MPDDREGDGTFRSSLISVLPHLRAFARGLCGQTDLADDLVQETAIKALCARDKFAPGTNMKAWTFTILRNTYLNQLRAGKRFVDYDPEMAERTLVEDASQEAGIHLSDMDKALQTLPPERREAVLLVGAGDFSYKEAAAICGVATGTMKSRVARGRAGLHAYFEGSEAAGSDADTDSPAGKPDDGFHVVHVKNA